MAELELSHLRALAAVLDTGSFEAAAASLHVTPSAISQRIKALENSAGQVLVRRTKPAEPTEAGVAYLKLARQIGLLLDDAASGSSADADLPEWGTPPTISVRLAINGDSLATWVLPALAALAHRVSFEIHREDQDHSTELLRSGSVMAAITSDAVAIQGCTVTRLGVMRYRAMASPAFVKRWFANGVDSSGFSRAPVLVFDRKDDLQDAFLRAHHPGATPPRHYMPGASDFAESIRLGFGWGMLPDLQSRRAESMGELVQLEPGRSTDVTLYWQQWSLDTPVLAEIAASISAAAKQVLT